MDEEPKQEPAKDSVKEESVFDLKGVEKIREGVYIRKSIFGYSMVYPLKNEDGTWNKKNVKWFLIKVFGIIAIACLALWMWKYDNRACFNIINNRTFVTTGVSNLSNLLNSGG